MTITIDTNNGAKKVLEREDYSTECFVCNVGGKLEATIQHNTSLTGNGSTASPLGVAISVNAGNAISNPGNGLYAVDYAADIASLDEGWAVVNEVWTGASAVTITVPSGATGRFQPFDKLRFKQGGGFKYGVIASVSSTLITLVTNNDYTVTVAGVTDIGVSRAENPFLWPDWFAYTPSNTQTGTMTFVISVVVAKWSITGKKLFIDNNSIGTTGGTADASIEFGVPTGVLLPALEFASVAALTDDGVGTFDRNLASVGFVTTSRFGVFLPSNANWTLGVDRRFSAQGWARLA